MGRITRRLHSDAPVIFSTILVLFLSVLLRAQGTSENEVIFESVDVNLVNVDVYVTDNDGKRVTDLAISDFEIYEDGRPVPITNFYAVEDRKYQRATPVVVRERLAESPAGKLLASPPLEDVEAIPDSQRLRVVIFMDNLNIRPFDRNKVMRELRRFLHDHVTPDDQVMVVSFNRWTHVRQPFTNDMRLISDALLDMEKDSGLRASGASERREVVRSIEMATNQTEALSHVELYAESIYHDMTTSLAALNDLVGSLSGLPERKALIHVSSGMPMTAADDLFQLIDLIWQNQAFSGKVIANRYSARNGYRRLAARANAARVTFYTVDATGLRSHNSLSAEYGGLGGNLSRTGSLTEVDFARYSNETESLQMMALDTGGLASFNTNNFFDALEKIGQDLGSYYSLGYPSLSTSDGRYHSIDVKVRRKGVKVRHREGFRSRTPEAEINDATYASLLYGRVSNQLDIDLDFSPLGQNEEGEILLPMAVRIPIGKITLLPQGEVHRAALRVSIAVIDDEGKLSPIDQKQVPIEIPLADLEMAQQKHYVYSAELLMRRGNQTVAVGVRDDFSGEISFIKQSVSIDG